MSKGIDALRAALLPWLPGDEEPEVTLGRLRHQVDAPYQHIHPLDEVFEYYLTTHQHYNKPPEIIALLREAFEFAWEPSGQWHDAIEDLPSVTGDYKVIVEDDNHKMQAVLRTYTIEDGWDTGAEETPICWRPIKTETGGE